MAKATTTRIAVQSLPPGWENWLQSGVKKRTPGRIRKAIRLQLHNGTVYGAYSNLPLNPKLKDSSALYPSVDHVYGRKHVNKQMRNRIVIETRIVNDMKSHLNPKGFWKLIEHLYHVGCEKRVYQSNTDFLKKLRF